MYGGARIRLSGNFRVNLFIFDGFQSDPRHSRNYLLMGAPRQATKTTKTGYGPPGSGAGVGVGMLRDKGTTWPHSHLATKPNT